MIEVSSNVIPDDLVNFLEFLTSSMAGSSTENLQQYEIVQE